MNITLKESKIQFKNPIIGQPTRAVEEHYHARRIIAIVDGEEKHFRFTKEELAFTSTEENISSAVKNQLNLESA